jgi:hypothetical protein
VDLDDLTPAGTSLRGALRPAMREPVATFTPPPDLALDAIWHGQRTNDVTRDGIQGSPFGYQPGHGFEHEPVNRAERASQQTVQTIADHAAGIRAALRPGSF